MATTMTPPPVADPVSLMPKKGSRARPLFVAWLVGVILIVGALTFFPALCLGPVVEHFLMNNGKLFSFLIVGFWS